MFIYGERDQGRGSRIILLRNTEETLSAAKDSV